MILMVMMGGFTILARTNRARSMMDIEGKLSGVPFPLLAEECITKPSQQASWKSKYIISEHLRRKATTERCRGKGATGRMEDRGLYSRCSVAKRFASSSLSRLFKCSSLASLARNAFVPKSGSGVNSIAAAPSSCCRLMSSCCCLRTLF